ncbi:MAG: GHKL domain-containing protein [Ignavibacteriales bacterium]|nr:MAG: GHKL domain-containing protein [Ignavibacteriales bacterium]
MIPHPILKDRQNLTIYLLIWLGVLLSYQANVSFGIGLELEYALADNLLINLFLPGLGISYWYSAKYISFENNSVIKIFLSHLFGGVFITALWLAIGYYLVNSVVGFSSVYTDFFLEILPWRIVVGILYYFLFTAFYYLIIYYSSYQERIVKESELKNLITQAELKSLKFQINPHFIFNSLNSMSALTVINPEKARSMILKLADFLRYTLASNEKQTTNLNEELKNIRLYLEIEKIRFEDKFDFIEDLEKECLNIKVPSMILQPLFENAIKHAVYEALEKVTLNLTAKLQDGFMEIKVENNFDGDSDGKSGTGIGLSNIRNRLELIYNRKDLFNIIKKKNLFSVTIYIPV